MIRFIDPSAGRFDLAPSCECVCAEMRRAVGTIVGRIGAILGLCKLGSLRGWISRRFRRALFGGRSFQIFAAHAVAKMPDGARLLEEASALVEEHLGLAARDHDESCGDLPCGFVLLHADAAGTSRVVGYVRIASAPGAISVRRAPHATQNLTALTAEETVYTE